jgi:anti-sigma-K factor RskA
MAAQEFADTSGLFATMSPGPPTDEEDYGLAAEYVAGVLPLAEREVFELRLRADSSLRQAVRFWDEQLFPLTEAVVPVNPPQRLLPAIEKRLFSNAQVDAGWTQSLAFWRGLSLVSLSALALATFLYLGPLNRQNTNSPNYVAQLAGPLQTVSLAVLYDAQKGELRFNRVAGSPQAGRDYQLWLIAGKNAPVSLGVLPVSANGVIKVNAAIKDKLPGAVLAISDEPAGGSPTGQPTGAVLATGSLATI